jgi:hypothetical protein
MNEELFLSATTMFSRVPVKTRTDKYYEFTEEQLREFVRDIVRNCAAIAEDNHSNYVKYGESLAGLTLPNTADLIKSHWELDE